MIPSHLCTVCLPTYLLLTLNIIPPPERISDVYSASTQLNSFRDVLEEISPGIKLMDETLKQIGLRRSSWRRNSGTNWSGVMNWFRYGFPFWRGRLLMWGILSCHLGKRYFTTKCVVFRSCGRLITVREIVP